jgi:hypothetical protein
MQDKMSLSEDMDETDVISKYEFKRRKCFY